jgi:DNA-binding CsgD family transcriptional regulator
MALFMDRHDLVNATPEEMARAHICDLAVQDKYGVKFVTYWYHYGAGNGFCLVEAPTQEAAEAAHREAHGNLACQVIEVDWPTVEGFMGRIREPRAGEPWEEIALRTIVYTQLDAATGLEHTGNRIIRRTLAARGGHDVEHEEGVIGCFPSVMAALEYASAMQQSFIPLASIYNRSPVEISMGIAVGEPVTEGFGLFGEVSRVAAGLCADAGPGEILVSGEVHDLCAGKGFRFEDRGDALLDGFKSSIRRYCLRGKDDTPFASIPAATTMTLPDGLSTRQLEVLRLIAIGKTNQEIADELFVTHATVAGHVRNIFNKIAVANRAEAASYAYKQHLVS